jgi:hypothetical protein
MNKNVETNQSRLKQFGFHFGHGFGGTIFHHQILDDCEAFGKEFLQFIFLFEH